MEDFRAAAEGGASVFRGQRASWNNENPRAVLTFQKNINRSAR